MKYTHSGSVVILLAFLSVSFAQTWKDDDSLIVSTSVGDVEGIWEHADNGKAVRVFYGIPYAAPPLGRRRFRPPEPVQPWKGILNCTKPTTACIQKRFSLMKANELIARMLGTGDLTLSEDCLQLNVFVPKSAGPKSPVMFWIHGGGFALGTGAVGMYDATTLAAEENVVVVTINYRLASFGFLYLGLDGAPGNVGLMDQTMALQWVQDHIANFNGDPDQVTVFGQSAGSVSIAFLLNHESSRNLFKRAILQSGTANSPFSMETTKRQLKVTEEFASNIGCPFSRSNLNATLECFLTKDANDLIENEPTWSYAFIFYYRPVLDGKYISKHPLDEIGKSYKEIISGTARDDAAIFFTAFYPFKFPFTDNFKLRIADVYEALHEFFGLNNVVVDLLFTIYPDLHDKSNAKRLRAVSKLGSDAFFFCPSVDMEDVMVQNGNKVYKYVFKQDIKATGIPSWYGSFHGSDIVYVFGDPLRNPDKYRESDRKLSRRMMQYWGNFARTGNPNILPNGQEMEIYWPETKRDDAMHLILASNSTSTGSTKASKRCTFWSEIIPKLIDHDEEKGIVSFRRPDFS